MARSRVVLVTGASSGLGLCLAKQLLKTPHRLVLTARATSMPRFSGAGIEESERVLLFPLDVTSETERQAVVDAATDRFGGVDILINNAGVSYRAVVEDVDDSDRVAQMDINFRSPMELTRLVLPGMRERRWGRIISISSVGGMMAMPTMAAYSASKFALEGAHEALWYEVRPWNISVTLVQPGFIHSRSFERVRYTERSAHEEADALSPYHWHYTNMTGFVARMMRLSKATPERVAAKVLRVVEAKRPPLRVAATPDAWMFSLLRRLLPRRIYHWILYRSLPGVNAWGPGTPPALPESSDDGDGGRRVRRD